MHRLGKPNKKKTHLLLLSFELFRFVLILCAHFCSHFWSLHAHIFSIVKKYVSCRLKCSYMGNFPFCFTIQSIFPFIARIRSGSSKCSACCDTFTHFDMIQKAFSLYFVRCLSFHTVRIYTIYVFISVFSTFYISVHFQYKYRYTCHAYEAIRFCGY